MLQDPKTAKGLMSWALLGIGGSIVALTIAYLFPALIPSKAVATKL